MFRRVLNHKITCSLSFAVSKCAAEGVEGQEKLLRGAVSQSRGYSPRRAHLSAYITLSKLS